MTDILATLRKTDKTKMPIDDNQHRILHRIAADEIERLRAELKDTQRQLGNAMAAGD